MQSSGRRQTCVLQRATHTCGRALRSAEEMAVEVGEIRKEGWVNKESAVIRTYRKRWMVLTPERLYSFKGEKKYTVRSRLLGTPYPYPYPYSHPYP